MLTTVDDELQCENDDSNVSLKGVLNKWVKYFKFVISKIQQRKKNNNLIVFHRLIIFTVGN